MEWNQFLKSLLLFNKLLYGLIILFFVSKPLEKESYLFIPVGFPDLEIPLDNQLTSARVEYGKKLFFEKLLSRDSSISCASCHQPQLAFTDGREKAVGIKNRVVSRNTPTLTNIGYNSSFLRDGVNPSLEAQVIVPIHEKNEFDFQIILVAERLKKNDNYVQLSYKAYGEEPNPNNISKAIASYERTLISGNSRFDKFYYSGDSLALTKNEKRGMDLFYNQLYCASCHSGFNFSNGKITNNGLYKEYLDIGKMRLTLNENDNGLFKVPTLRNISLTAPYMHDGSIARLEDVINHYSKGGKGHYNQHPIISPFEISNQDRDDLISFLESLTDSSFIVR